MRNNMKNKYVREEKSWELYKLEHLIDEKDNDEIKVKLTDFEEKQNKLIKYKIFKNIKLLTKRIKTL